MGHIESRSELSKYGLPSQCQDEAPKQPLRNAKVFNPSLEIRLYCEEFRRGGGHVVGPPICMDATRRAPSSGLV